MGGLWRMATIVAIYSARRTAGRPPRIIRRSRHSPLSRLKGAMPTSAAIRRRFSWPSSGSSANEGVGGDVPDARRRGEQIFRLPPDGTRPNEALDIALELFNRPRQPRHVRGDTRLQPTIAHLAAAVHFSPDHLDELPTSGYEFAQHLRLFRGQWPRRRLHGFGEPRSHPRVQRVRLRQLAGGPGEIPDLPRIDHRDRQAGIRQHRGHLDLIAAGGLPPPFTPTTLLAGVSKIQRGRSPPPRY